MLLSAPDGVRAGELDGRAGLGDVAPTGASLASTRRTWNYLRATALPISVEQKKQGLILDLKVFIQPA